MAFSAPHSRTRHRNGSPTRARKNSRCSPEVLSRQRTRSTERYSCLGHSLFRSGSNAVFSAAYSVPLSHTLGTGTVGQSPQTGSISGIEKPGRARETEAFGSSSFCALFDLRPGVLESNCAVKDRSSGFRIRIRAEIAQSLKLVAVASLGSRQ